MSGVLPSCASVFTKSDSYVKFPGIHIVGVGGDPGRIVLTSEVARGKSTPSPEGTSYAARVLLSRLALPAFLLTVLGLVALPVPGGNSTTVHRIAGPTYTWSATPSPVVLLLPNRTVRLRPKTYCWSAPDIVNDDGSAIGSSTCARQPATSNAELVKVARTGKIRFWFGRPGWHWNARLISVAHPRRAGCDLSRVPAKVSAQRFDLAPPRYRGTYRVRLVGRGPEGMVQVRFVWRYGTSAGRCS